MLGYKEPFSLTAVLCPEGAGGLMYQVLYIQSSIYYIVFTYYNSNLTDNITLKTYNSTNGKFKTSVIPIILKTTNTIPNNIASNVNTQDYQYNNVSVSFNKNDAFLQVLFVRVEM